MSPVRRDEFFVVGDERFEALAVAHQRLRAAGFGPHGGVGELCFDVG